MFKDSLPLVSVITVNYKQTDVTLLLLESLRKCTYPNLEIIVVDNGSGQGIEPILKAQYPEVICITSLDNLGFAGGNNLGIEKSIGKYLFFINNDTEVEPGFLEPMVNLAENDSSIGLVSPKIIYFDTDRLIQYAGSTGINPFTGRGEKIGSFVKDEGQYDTTYETGLGHGAAMLIPRSVIEKVGMMPDIFFLYYEEHDWCEAIKRAGYKVYYVGQSLVYHKESVSVGRASTLKTFYMTRNRILFLRRNNKFLLRASTLKTFYMTRNRILFLRRNNKFLALTSSLLFFVFLTVPKNTLKYLLKANWDHLKAFYKGIGWNLTHFKVHGFPHLKNHEFSSTKA